MKYNFYAMVLLLCSVIISANSQVMPFLHGTGDHEGCAFDQIHEESLQTYEYRFSHETMEKDIYDRQTGEYLGSSGKTDDDGEVKTLPVVVHVVHRVETEVGESENFSDAKIDSLMEIVNASFRHESGEQFDNPYLGRDIGIQFCLATRDPNNQPTNGIIRHADDVLTFEVMDILSGPVIPAYQWDPKKYINVFLVYNISGFGAYANLANVHGKPYDGIVISHWMGSNTWTHEFGHYFNLLHVFHRDDNQDGCAPNSNCLGEGDRVCDTSPTFKHRLECEDNDYDSCSNDVDDSSENNPFRRTSQGGIGNQPDPIENIMSYDYCRKGFTEGQRVRMRDALFNMRFSLLDSEACTPIDNDYDASISEVLSPNGLMCSNRVHPEVTILNYGIENLTSAEIEVLLDGNLIETYDWSGNLENGFSENVVFDEITINSGSHNLEFIIKNPNGQSDQYPINDSKAQDFTRDNPNSIPLNSNCSYAVYSSVDAVTSGVEKPPCGRFGGDDLWFEVIVPSSGHLVVSTLPTLDPEILDGALAVYKNDCNNLELIVCANRGSSGDMPKVEALGLEPGTTVYVRFWVPQNASEGTFSLCAYDGNGVGSDFSFSKLELTPGLSSPYGGINAKMTVLNNGTIYYDYVTIGLYLSADNVFDESDMLLNQYWQHGISSYDTVTVTEGLYLPASITDGEWHIFAKVDFTDEIMETDESNNIIMSTVEVTTSEFIVADLQTTEEEVFPSIVSPYDDISVTCNYRNYGEGAAGPNYLRYYLSRDTIFGYGDEHLDYNRHDAGLLPGTFQFMHNSFSLPAGIEYGDWYILFISDENQNVFEENESNNVGWAHFEVAPSPYLSRINLQVYLEGFMDFSTNRMNSNYVEENLLPAFQPFYGAPYFYNGGEVVNSFPSNIVDWVLVEVRRGDGPSTLGAPGLEVVERRAALINENGWIVDLDGTSSLNFYNIDPSVIEPYWFVVRHKSHLDVIYKEQIYTPIGHSYYFTDGVNKAFGNQQQNLMQNGKAGMIPGDFDGNGVNNVNDFNLWSNNNADVYVYYSYDVDGSSIINVNDYNLWVRNGSRVGLAEIQY